jgi:ketosteroid isomerase-like protein
MANVAVVQAFITAFGSGDAETALDQLHDDVQVSEPAGLPIGDAGDMAVAHLNLTWTAHSTGASLDTQFCELYTVDGDKITSINVFPKDTKALYDLTAAAVAPLP